jgi:hypothetical protein
LLELSLFAVLSFLLFDKSAADPNTGWVDGMAWLVGLVILVFPAFVGAVTLWAGRRPEVQRTTRIS